MLPLEFSSDTGPAVLVGFAVALTLKAVHTINYTPIAAAIEADD